MAEQAIVPAIRFAGFTDPWEQRKLGDVADIKTGPFGTLLHAEDYVDDGIPIVTTEHFKTGVLPKDKEGIPQVSEEDAKRLEQYRAKEGDILFSRVGSVDANAQVFAGQDGWLFSGRVLRARPDLTLVSSAYLHYELETEEVKSSVISRAVGGTMASINTEILFQTPIFIPAKMTEQNKIGSTCARLDSLITLHQRKYDKLVVFKKSMLEKMFPKDGESVPEIRFAGFTDPWEQRKFVDFVEASGIRNKDNLQLESYSVSNDRGFVPQDEQFENGGTMRDADKTAYWIVEPGSFAYNPARINVGSIGYQSTRKNVIVSSLYEVFKTDRSCDDRFLWHWFKSSLFTKQIEMLQEGGVRLYFFFDKLQKSEIWMPNVDEQRIIGQQFDQLDSLITLHQRKLELLRNIKKSLLDRMFV